MYVFSVASLLQLKNNLLWWRTIAEIVSSGHALVWISPLECTAGIFCIAITILKVLHQVFCLIHTPYLGRSSRRIVGIPACYALMLTVNYNKHSVCMFYWYYPLATNMQTQGGKTLCVFVADLCAANIWMRKIYSFICLRSHQCLYIYMKQQRL
jgi:hypothetical protein